jgi:hypothetical protein
VFIAHPRDGILGYFDQYGFDPFAGAPGAPVFATSTFYVLAGQVIDNRQRRRLRHARVDAFELFTSKRLDTHRTPTQPEVDAYQGDGQTERTPCSAPRARWKSSRR